MPSRKLPLMALNLAEEKRNILHEFWPLAEVDPNKASFPCCIVWTPLPVVSWLAPFIGHVGICREDGTILDFSGSNLINIDDFAFGSVARYIQLDRKQSGIAMESFCNFPNLREVSVIRPNLKVWWSNYPSKEITNHPIQGAVCRIFRCATNLYIVFSNLQCCFPPNLSGHTCKHRYAHAECGPAITWDDALQTSGRLFENKSYNLFTCNCHSFVANCLNRLCYEGSMNWNMVNVASFVLFKGKWVNGFSVVRSFLPFILVMSFGVYMVGWPFLIGLFSFSFLLVGWFLCGTYAMKNVLDC